MRDEAWIIHACHSVVCAQRFDHSLGVLHMLSDSRVQCPHAAQRQIAVERGARDAKAVRPPRELVAGRGLARDDRAADDISMAVELLRRRVAHDVGAERDRLLQRW